MPNPRLTREQSNAANSLLESIRSKLLELSKGDLATLFAMRRRLYIRLSYDERGTPAHGGNQWSLDADQASGMDEFVHLCFMTGHPMLNHAINDGRIQQFQYWL
jgi:hypothetical protein